MANVQITNKTEQTLEIDLYDVWGTAYTRLIEAGASFVIDRLRVTARTWNLGRQGHLRFVHQS